MGSGQSTANDGPFKGGASRAGPSAPAAPAAPVEPVGAPIEQLPVSEAEAMMSSWGRNLADQIRAATILLLAPKGSELRDEVANVDMTRIVDELKNTVDRDYYRRISYLLGFMHAFTDPSDMARADRLSSIMYRSDLDANEQKVRDTYDTLEAVRQDLGMHIEIAIKLLTDVRDDKPSVGKLSQAFKDSAESIGAVLDSTLKTTDAFYSMGLVKHANLTIEQALATNQDNVAESVAKGQEAKNLLIAFSLRLAQNLDNVLIPVMNNL
jgi:hypothetical protein